MDRDERPAVDAAASRAPQPQARGLGAYASIARTREAYAFDLGTLLMRLYMPMVTLGIVSMLTLAGHSALFAGTVSSTAAASLFVLSPRVSKLVDERGQSAVVPWAALLAMGALFALLAVVHFELPRWLCYPCAAFMGFSPQPQALARTRWLYLIETGRLGPTPPSVRTVFSYEGVLDDVAFMFGPAVCIALSASVAPVAGMLFGGVSYLVGAALLLRSKATEPDGRWRRGGAVGAQEGRGRSAIVEYPMVRALFALMLLEGCTFGIFDATTVSFTEELGRPTVASACLMASAAVSAVSGLVFGAVGFRVGSAALLALTASMFGLGYASMLFIETVPVLFAVSVVAAGTYAPFFISTNNMCERSVPKGRITEALTWVGAGYSCGTAIGPTLSGAVVDTFGATAGFDVGAVFALAIVPVALVAYCMAGGFKKRAVDMEKQ